MSDPFHEPLDPDVMRFVALGLADGQIEQADVLLLDPWAPAIGSHHGKLQLERALEHMRSACGWLTCAAERNGAR